MSLNKPLMPSLNLVCHDECKAPVYNVLGKQVQVLAFTQLHSIFFNICSGLQVLKNYQTTSPSVGRDLEDQPPLPFQNQTVENALIKALMAIQCRKSKFQIKIIHLADSDMYCYLPEVKEKSCLSDFLLEIPSYLNIHSIMPCCS